MKTGSYGGKWSNLSTEKQFGIAGQKGILKFEGSPRWKQRAFYDFVKDFSYELIGTPVVRLSIWDEINHEEGILTFNQILKRDFQNFSPAIIQLINTRSIIKNYLAEKNQQLTTKLSAFSKLPQTLAEIP